MHLTLGEITAYWTGFVLGEDKTVPLDHLQKVEMPESLHAALVQQGEILLNKELTRIIDSPFLDLSSKSGDTVDLRDTLKKILLQRMVLPGTAVKAMVENVFSAMFDQWRVEPLGLREASEDPNGLAANILQRVAQVLPASTNGSKYSLDIVAQVCEASGISSVASAILLEKELEVDQVDNVELGLIIRRFIMLKEHYRIGRNLVSFEGTGRTLVAAKPIPKAPEPVPVPSIAAAPQPQFQPQPVISPTPTPASKPVPAAPVVTPKVAAPSPAPSPAPIVTGRISSATIPAGALFISPELTAKGGKFESEQKAGGTETIVPVKPVPDEIPQEAAFLYILLMAEKKRSYLADALFDENYDDYDKMVLQVTRQKTLKNALVVADNELYIRNIPVSAIPASELLRTIKNCYGKDRFD